MALYRLEGLRLIPQDELQQYVTHTEPKLCFREDHLVRECLVDVNRLAEHYVQAFNERLAAQRRVQTKISSNTCRKIVALRYAGFELDVNFIIEAHVAIAPFDSSYDLERSVDATKVGEKKVQRTVFKRGIFGSREVKEWRSLPIYQYRPRAFLRIQTEEFSETDPYKPIRDALDAIHAYPQLKRV